MCDTLVSVSKNNLSKNVTYFAKNSDREPDEIQLVEYHPRVIRKDKLKVTHIEIDFENEIETNAILISRPYWMWGAEMGLNEYGVAIGNEAIFTKRKFDHNGLLGMDLLRLGLEFGKNSKSALDVIIEYLEKYGQNGSNSLKKDEYYDNSFLITDKNEAYILEIYGKQYRYIKIGDYGAISNIPSIMFQDNENHKINFKLNIFYNYFGRGSLRYKKTIEFLKNGSGKIDVTKIMDYMRSHSTEKYSPKIGSNKDICMHSGYLTRKYQTANSMVLEIYDNLIISWFTFSPNPCISLYKPLFFNFDPIKINYDKEYWEKTREIHKNIEKFDPERYKKVMELTLENQARINEIVNNVKNKILTGNLNLDLEKVYDDIFEIDKEHIIRLQDVGVNI